MSKKDWVSVDERLPEAGVMVLVAIDIDGCHQYDTDYLEEGGTWRYTDNMPACMEDKIVAWCPIPELPQRILEKMRCKE